MTQTSVIIVAYNSRSLLNQCLASVAAARPLEIIIIDNSLHAQSQPIAVRFAAAYHHQPQNLGFAAAANLGARLSRGRYLLFLNPDTIIPPHLISSLEQYFAAYPHVAITSPQLLGPGGHPEPSSYGPEVTPLSLVSRHVLKPRPAGASIGWVSGAALSIRRSVFQELNGFDPRFFMYWEDIDLCRRARSISGPQAWQIHLLKNLKVTHIRGGSGLPSSRKTSYYDQSADRYFRKYYPAPIWLSLRLLRSLYRLWRPHSH